MRLKRKPLLEAEPLDIETIDPRRELIEAERETTVVGREVIEDALRQLGVDIEDDKVAELAALRTDIREDWTRASTSFLSIGRALIRINRDILRDTSFRRFLDETKVFPFGFSMAYKLMAVARDVDAKRFEQVLPDFKPDYHLPAWSAAYELVAMPDDHLKAAAAEGLLRADVRVVDVKAFKRRLKEATPRPPRVDFVVLARERTELEKRKRALADEMARIETRLEEIARLLPNY
jgi:hypothetical protein